MKSSRLAISGVPKSLQGFFLVAVAVFLLGGSVAHAASERTINRNVDNTLARFYTHVRGGKKLVERAAGVLVFPSVVKIGFGIGGQTGVGALREKGRTVAYYRTTGLSFGFQFGGQTASMVLVFMQPHALKEFRQSSGWEAGVNGSIAVVKVGAGGTVDTTTMNQPIVAFVFGREGLMYNLSLEGSKYTRIHPGP